MKFLGNPIFATPPQPCDDFAHADCTVHGFGLSKSRADVVVDTLMAHARACFSLPTNTIDWPRYWQGPAELDLQTAAEVFCASNVMTCLGEQMTQQQEARASMLAMIKGKLPKDLADQIGVTVIAMTPDGPQVIAGADAPSGNGKGRIVTVPTAPATED